MEMLVVFCGASASRMGLYFHVFYAGNHADHSVGPYQMPLGLSVLQPSGRCRTRCQLSRPVTVYCLGARLDCRPAGLLAALENINETSGTREFKAVVGVHAYTRNYHYLT
jgi:hypothetical protein